MDDPFNWDVDRVVQELCSPGRTWIPSPELPPAQQLEACLREQGADGHTILTYPDESELCESLGIKTLKHKNTFKHARRELRQRSRSYQHYLSNPFAPENTLAPRAQHPAAPAGSSVDSASGVALAPAAASSAPNESASRKELGTAPTLVLDKQEKQPPALSTDIATKKKENNALMSANLTDFKSVCNDTDSRNGPATIGRQENVHIMKRKGKENHNQHYSKRPKRDVEVIELSDDDDDDNQVSTQERGPTDNISDSNGSRNLDTEFGGRHANRHITEDDWKRVCKMFQCPASTTSLKPPGFDIEIAAYQLHAIWWILTQQPVRGIQGGCLGDAMGLGKTIEVLSTFATFAMIKAPSIHYTLQHLHYPQNWHNLELQAEPTI
ncbi:hypothetical protein F4824DRAFT_504224 [Ustulina deusta]|nr:hypothetical protein F4824DRAFT_504224 [Ustulina deusta]